MNNNEHYNHYENGKEEIVSLSYPISDILYTQVYRKRLAAARLERKADPDAEINSAGILIVSDKLNKGEYAIKTTLFGSFDNIINTMSHVLIDKLTIAAPNDREDGEQMLTNFLNFFIGKAKAEFFKLYEDDEESD